MVNLQRYIRLLPILAVVALLSALVGALPVRAASGSVSPQQGGVGTRFEFRASGFTPGERVDFWVTAPNGATYTRYPSVNTEADGRIAWSWDVVAGAADGDWDMTAYGADSKTRLVIGFTVVGAAGAPLPDQVSPTSGARGTTFNFTVTGMTPEEVVSVWFIQPNGKAYEVEPTTGPSYANERGMVNWSWTSPNNALSGNWYATFHGMVSNRNVNIQFTITSDPLPPPNNYVWPASGAPGTIFHVGVGGLQPDEEVGSWLVRPDGKPIGGKDYMRADDSGSVTWYWESPTDAISGEWKAVTKGKKSGTIVILPFSVGGDNPAPSDPSAPTVSVSPASVHPGDTITISATGFGTNEKLGYWPTRPDGVVIRSGDKAGTDWQGSATWTYQIPQNAIAGQWTMNVHGDDTNRDAQTSFSVTQLYEPGSSVSPASGPPGTTFTFTASGFLDDYEKVFFWFIDPNGQTVDGPGAKDSNNDNTVTWEWTAPSDVLGGQWQAVARGRSSGVQRVIPFTIVRDQSPNRPSASVSPEVGAPGTTFTFSANGYEEDELVGYWLNQPDGSIIRFDHEIMANHDGRVTWTWTAPADAQRGLYTMAVRSSLSDGVSNDVSYSIRFSVQ